MLNNKYKANFTPNKNVGNESAEGVLKSEEAYSIEIGK